MTYKKKAELAIQEIAQKIQTHYKPEKIILFGSYAYGKPTKDSDIDLFIIKNTRKTRMDRWMKVRAILCDPKRKIPVSPLIFTNKEVNSRLSMGDDFVEEIVERGKILYEKE